MWGKEEYMKCDTKYGRYGKAWMKVGIWKLREISRGTDKWSCSLRI
jgi:hypothetical protein